MIASMLTINADGLRSRIIIVLHNYSDAGHSPRRKEKMEKKDKAKV